MNLRKQRGVFFLLKLSQSFLIVCMTLRAKNLFAASILLVAKIMQAHCTWEMLLAFSAVINSKVKLS